MRLRLLTWNIHKGIGGLDRRYQFGRIVEVIRHHAPDVALLQEVADDLPASHFHDQAPMLAEALGMPHLAFHPEHRFRLGGYGNAILSRWPLSRVTHEDLTVGWRKKRGVLQARARVRVGRGSRTVVLHNVHLGLAGSEREQQLQRFLACEPFRGLHARTPLVVGGDLNDLWGTLGSRFLVPAGFRRAGSLVSTFPAVLPIRPLDGLFVRGDLRALRCGASRLGLARQASDHLPLVAELELAEDADAPPSSRPSLYVR